MNFTIINAQNKFDFKELPFSKFGSYTAFSEKYDSATKASKLYMRDVSGKYAWLPDEIFDIELLVNGNAEHFVNFDALPWKLICKTQSAQLEIVFENTRIVRFRASKNANVRITKVKVDPRGWEWSYPVTENQYRIHGGFDNYIITALNGAKLTQLVGERIDGRKKPANNIWTQFEIAPSSSGTNEFAMEKHVTGWLKNTPSLEFDSCASHIQNEFVQFESLYPAVDKKYEQSKFIASYVNWSCVVEPQGNIKRNGMLMSKALMRHIWSWDHCFNALALSYNNPQLAWDQFMVVFDNLQPSGAVADYVNDHHFQLDYVKPPIHGLIYKRMIERNPYFGTNEKLSEIYVPLTRWTNHWFTYLDDDNDGLPQYNHGCNSGWDNNTVFDIGFPVEGSDLAAFLVLQMEFLSEVATKLGKPVEATEWANRSKALLKLMIDKLWTGNGFISTRSGDNEYNKKSQSLMPYLPMILGERLPKEIREKMLANLKNSGLVTPYGPATENPASPFYERDGYWRGPVWAPSTYLIVEGIKACGDTAYAKELAHKFCETCNKSGFRENFVATTGEGLRDLGYTWTSSVFLVLAHEYRFDK